MDNVQFSLLLDYFSFSWEGYQKVKKGVKKRIARHMDALGCLDMNEYIRMLDRRQDLRRECERRLSVPVSRFFRDYPLWEVLSDKILPGFWDKASLRVWSAGCAGGEEVYSLKILWHQLKENRTDPPRLRVIASDLNSENLERAQKGVYSASSFKETPEVVRGRFFEKGPTRKTWTIKSFLKDEIQWNKMNLHYDPPPVNNCDIIFLRNNILLYASKKLKRAGFKNVASGLADDGFLIIGTKDTLPGQVAGFQCFELPYVFRKTAPRLA